MVNFFFGPIRFLPFIILLFFFDKCHATVAGRPLSMKGAAPIVSSGSKKQFASFKSNSSYGNDAKNSMGMGGSKNILQMAPKLNNIPPLSIRHSPMRPINAIPINHANFKPMVENANNNNNYKGDWATMEMEKLEKRLYKGLYGENVEEDQQEGEWHHLTAAFEQLPPYAQDRIAELALATCVALEMLSELTALKTEYRAKYQYSKDNNPSLGDAHQIIPADQSTYATKMMDIFGNSIKQIYPHLDQDNNNLLTNVAKIFADATEFCRLFSETEPMEFMRYYFDDMEDELQNKELMALLETKKVQMENIHKWLQKMIEYLANYEDKEKPSAIFLLLVQETSPIPPTSPPRRRTV